MVYDIIMQEDSIMLTKRDLENIGKIVEEKVGNAFDKKTPGTFSHEIGLFRLEMNQRFDEADQKIDKAETQISDKLDEWKQIILRRRAKYRTGP